MTPEEQAYFKQAWAMICEAPESAVVWVPANVMRLFREAMLEEAVFTAP